MSSIELKASDFTDVERANFWRHVRVDASSGCWLWSAKNSSGYGTFGYRGKIRMAHRVAYAIVRGIAPSKPAQLDHLCRVRHCVRPDHLEPVDSRENTLRGRTLAAAQVKRTHCPQGHEYTASNTKVGKDRRRHCRACHNASERVRYAKGRGQ